MSVLSDINQHKHDLQKSCKNVFKKKRNRSTDILDGQVGFGTNVQGGPAPGRRGVVSARYPVSLDQFIGRRVGPEVVLRLGAREVQRTGTN